MEQDRILSFIKLMNESVPDAQEVFTSGNCGCFARILLFAFPRGKILEHWQTHYVFELDGISYDIRGEVTDLYREIELTPLSLEMKDINGIISSLEPRYQNQNRTYGNKESRTK